MTSNRARLAVPPSAVCGEGRTRGQRRGLPLTDRPDDLARHQDQGAFLLPPIVSGTVKASRVRGKNNNLIRP